MTLSATVAVAVDPGPGGDAGKTAAAPSPGPTVCVVPAGRDEIGAEVLAAALGGALRRAGGCRVVAADDGQTDRTKRWLEQAAVILLVGRGGGDPRLRPVELLIPPPTAQRRVELVLVHEPGVQWTSGAGAWLAERALDAHHHLRMDHPADLPQVARAICDRLATVLRPAGRTLRP